MSKVNEFLENCDLIKGRKPAAVGALSKDGTRRKVADGSWQPVKKQRKGRTPVESKPKAAPSKGKDYEGIAPEYHKYVDRAKATIVQMKAALKANPGESRHWQADLKRAEAILPKVIAMSRQLTQTVMAERGKAEAFLKQNKLTVGDKVKVKVGTHLTFGDQFGIGTVKVNKDGTPYIAVPSNQSPDKKAKRLSFNNPWEKVRANAKPVEQQDPVPANARLALNWIKTQLTETLSSGAKSLVKFDTDSNGNIVVRQGRRKQVVATKGKSYSDLKAQLLSVSAFLVQIRMQQK